MQTVLIVCCGITAYSERRCEMKGVGRVDFKTSKCQQISRGTLQLNFLKLLKRQHNNVMISPNFKSLVSAYLQDVFIILLLYHFEPR